MRRPRLLLLAAAALFVLVLRGVPAAQAGGGPETTIVVENADSPLSRHVANEYVRRRKIPTGHVLSIPGLPTLHGTDVGTFRTAVLARVREFLKERRLDDRIDLVVYSVDFPYSVNFSADGPSAVPQSPPVGSTTGMTYLENRVAAKATAEYSDFQSIVNGYFRRTGTTGAATAWASRAFTSRAGWGADEEPDPAAPADSPGRHRMAAMLGWAGTWGNTLPEILAVLGPASDGTAPSGTVYLCRSGDDARSGPRAPFFAETIAELEAMGRKATVLAKGDGKQTGALPVEKDDVVGAVVGVAGFSWPECGSRLLPGAFADHLTSFAAAFEHAGQTKCSAWIRAGATGTCGTVVEPLNAFTKFPTPRLHVHYAAGCSLAEAYYQSVASPYQTLLLGDPLARPYAKFATLDLAPAAGPSSGVVVEKPKVVPAAGTTVASVELFVDGVFVAEAKPGEDLRWDTTAFDDGTHEVRAVAVEEGLVATRSFALATRVVANGKGAAPTLSWPKAPVALDRTVDLSGKAPGAKTVEVLANGRRVAEAPVVGTSWSAKGVPAEALGLGPVTVQARAVPAAGPAVLGPRLDVTIAPPAVRRKPKGKGKAPAPAAGLRATLTDAAGKTQEVVLASLGGPGVDAVAKAVAAKGKGPWTRVVIEGEFAASVEGLHQFDVLATGALRLDVDEKPLLAARKDAPLSARYGLANLEAGWHSLEIDWTPAGPLDLVVLLAGAQVAAPLSGASLRH